MGKSYRTDQAAEDIKYALVEILRHVKDSRVSQLLSIVRVELARDLSQVKVYISALDGFESTLKSVEGLKSGSGFVRKALSQRLKLRKAPEVIFIADNSIEHSAHINSIIHELKKKD